MLALVSGSGYCSMGSQAFCPKARVAKPKTMFAVSMLGGTCLLLKLCVKGKPERKPFMFRDCVMDAANRTCGNTGLLRCSTVTAGHFQGQLHGYTVGMH